jgi:two-component system copper resistance phosphate regulon response regulator CusR
VFGPWRPGPTTASSSPIAFTELIARIDSVTRRDKVSSLLLGDLEVDLVQRRAVRAGRRLDLTAQEFSLLSLLLGPQGEVLSWDELCAQMWNKDFDGASNVLEVAVSRLRAKLDDRFEEKLLHTVRGVGYVLERRSEPAR